MGNIVLGSCLFDFVLQICFEYFSLSIMTIFFYASESVASAEVNLEQTKFGAVSSFKWQFCSIDSYLYSSSRNTFVSVPTFTPTLFEMTYPNSIATHMVTK